MLPLPPLLLQTWLLSSLMERMNFGHLWSVGKGEVKKQLGGWLLENNIVMLGWGFHDEDTTTSLALLGWKGGKVLNGPFQWEKNGWCHCCPLDGVEEGQSDKDPANLHPSQQLSTLFHFWTSVAGGLQPQHLLQIYSETLEIKVSCRCHISDSSSNVELKCSGLGQITDLDYNSQDPPTNTATSFWTTIPRICQIPMLAEEFEWSPKI